MAETFKKSQMSEFFDVSSGCLCSVESSLIFVRKNEKEAIVTVNPHGI